MEKSVDDLIDQTYAARREHRLSDARRTVKNAISKARKSGRDAELARALMALGQVERDEGHYGTARPVYEEAVALYRETGNDLMLAHAVRHLGDLYQELDNLSLAEVCYDEALAIYRSTDEVSALALANAIRPLAILKDKVGDGMRARELWEESKTFYEQAGVYAGVSECAAHLAGVAAKDT